MIFSKSEEITSILNSLKKEYCFLFYQVFYFKETLQLGAILNIEAVNQEELI